MNCERCPSECELMPSHFPWNEEYWICPECGSTYIYEWDRENQVRGELKAKVEMLDVIIPGEENAP